MNLDPSFATRLDLEAIDGAHNIRRGYAIERAVDLFGFTVVSVSWGRIGARRQARTLAFADDGAARRFIRTLLVRRNGARARIGVAYREVSRS